MYPGLILSSVARTPLEDGVDLWLGRPEDIDSRARACLLELLDDAERERARRFVFERDRECYTFAHGFLRLILARYINVDPHTLRFVGQPNGRPELATLAGHRPLRFNLSHTRGLVACIVTSTADCGVDVERGSRANYRDLIPLVLAASEAAELAALPEESQADRFLEIWTLKEAYLKGRGLGLAAPLREIAFAGSETAPRCSTSSTLDDDDRAWRFWSGRPTSAHWVAVALRTGGRRSTLSIIDVGSNLQSARVSSVLQF
jgi:4'-phosphopantetheinyl transferase